MVVDLRERLRIVKSNKADVKIENGKPTTITKENIAKFVKGEITWAQVYGLTMQQAYAMAEIGYQLFQQGKYQDAQTVFEGLIVLNPYDSYFHSVMGSILTKTGQEDKAIREYSISANLDPKNPQILVDRAELLLKKGQFQEALTDLKQATSLDPTGKNPAVIRARGLASATIKLLEEVLKSKQQQASAPKK